MPTIAVGRPEGRVQHCEVLVVTHVLKVLEDGGTQTGGKDSLEEPEKGLCRLQLECLLRREDRHVKSNSAACTGSSKGQPSRWRANLL